MNYVLRQLLCFFSHAWIIATWATFSYTEGTGSTRCKTDLLILNSLHSPLSNAASSIPSLRSTPIRVSATASTPKASSSNAGKSPISGRAASVNKGEDKRRTVADARVR